MSLFNVEFAGLHLKSPIIAASAPPTESFHNIVKCAEFGVGAIVTKTSAIYDVSQYTLGGRRTYVDERGLWAQGTFRRETLSLDAGVNLVSQAVSKLDIPIIASVASISLDVSEWLDACLAMQDAGASMIQLDLFYIPQPRCSPENTQKLRLLFSYLSKHLVIPIAPKLNLDFPPHYAVDLLRDTGVAAVFLLDSVRVPVPIDIYEDRSLIPNLISASECSLFGEWQKPLTLQYTSVLYRNLGLPICAGGGLANGKDAIEAMMWGATTVQYATAIIKHGYERIVEIHRQIETFLKKRPDMSRVADVIGHAQKITHFHTEEVFIAVRAFVSNDLCILCGKCTKIVFCDSIHFSADSNVVIDDTCDGCGLCASVCPVDDAITIMPLSKMDKGGDN